jgi:hypothetical protein
MERRVTHMRCRIFLTSETGRCSPLMLSSICKSHKVRCRGWSFRVVRVPRCRETMRGVLLILATCHIQHVRRIHTTTPCLDQRQPCWPANPLLAAPSTLWALVHLIYPIPLCLKPRPEDVLQLLCRPNDEFEIVCRMQLPRAGQTHLLSSSVSSIDASDSRVSSTSQSSNNLKLLLHRCFDSSEQRLRCHIMCETTL